MKAHLIDTHLLVPRSRSSAKVKVKYLGHVSQKMDVLGALVFHKHILFHNVFKSCLLLMCRNEYLWSEGLIPCLENLTKRPMENNWEKEKILVISIFSPLYKFSTFPRINFSFGSHLDRCHQMFRIWESLHFVVW